MKLVARALSVLALLAFATPALPCGDQATKTTTASADKEKEKGSNTVAKSDKKSAKKTKSAEQSKPATATN